MLKNNSIIQTTLGNTLRVEMFLGAGGQGQVYIATDQKTGQSFVIKTFNTINKDLIERIKYLVSLNLNNTSLLFCSPIDSIIQSGVVGHCAPLAPGESLEEFLTKPEGTIADNLQIAIAIAQSLVILEDLGLIHGDIQPNNFFIEKKGTSYSIKVIDLDNFRSLNNALPLPPAIGHLLTMAPELRQNMEAGIPTFPTLYSDRFALACILHEVLLRNHPASGSDSTQEDFNRAITSGYWIHDPAYPHKPKTVIGGYPPEILNSDISSKFRRAFSLTPQERPSAKEWRDSLVEAFKNQVMCCPRPGCGGPILNDISKQVCMWCKKQYPHLRLVLGNGTVLPLEQSSGLLGRNLLGGVPTVSEKHASYQRFGLRTVFKSFGSNGTYRYNGNTWVRLPDQKEITIEDGDQLRFADQEARVEMALI